MEIDVTLSRKLGGDQTIEAFPKLKEMQESDTDEWKVSWDGGGERITSVAGIAWYAEMFDPEATIEAL